MELITDSAKWKNSSMQKHDSAQAVFCVQMSGLIIAIQQTLAEIKNDQNIEALHVYRVKLRQARALLSVFSCVLPSKLIVAMEEDVKALFSATGSLRDFDLLLDKLTQTKQQHKFGHAECVIDLKTKRQRELERFVIFIQSSEFRHRIDHLHACLDNIVENDERMSLKECWPLLLKKSIKDAHAAYKRLWVNSNEKQIHSLRKSLKKLRYCIELLGLIVKPRAAKKALDWLKKKQGSLGEYNDIRVQSSLLKGNIKTNKSLQKNLFKRNLSKARKRLPLAKSDWKMLRQKLQPLL